MIKKTRWFLLFFIFLTIALQAQKGGLPLGDEYYKSGEYAKAKSIYENFIGDLESTRKVYDKYLNCLVQLKEFDNAEKFIKKVIKWDASNPMYKIDLADLYLKQNKNSDAKKQFDKIIKTSSESPDLVIFTTDYLTKLGHLDVCKQIYLQTRKKQGNDYLFSLEMAEIFKREKNADEMVTELIRVLLANQNDKEFLKAKFQDFITTDEEFKIFETAIFAKIQDEPTQYLYNDLLIWIYMQQKNFERAFIQAKAYDRLMKNQGNKLMEVGRIALENKDYESAVEIFDYVVREYKNSPNYGLARKFKIQSKEEEAKSVYPIEPLKIRSLIADYKGLLTELGKSPQTMDPMRSMAVLYGFYLNSKDTAVQILEEVLKYPWLEASFSAKCKLDLGDIYLLKNEPWEATLIYSQVEKAQKESIMGHEAKLRNAKLSYYTGQFEIAQEHLDVLKLATTREIANDAMDLSLFIQDNIGMDADSTHQAMQQYANVELLMFQNRYNEALIKLDSILKAYKDHSLTDEIYFLQAKVYRKLGKYDVAVSKLETLENLYKSDIYGDDAAYMLATIYDENLNDKEKAMTLFNKFLIDFPSSIYTSEARKRFRALRGDNLN